MQTPRILSCGIIPIFKQSQEPLYLLLRAYNYWDFPKGVVAPQEDPLDAAIRELLEETTIQNVKFTWGRDFKETPPYARGKVARYYLGEVGTQVVSITPNPQTHIVEHHEFRWVTFSEGRKLASDRVKTIFDWAKTKMSGDEFLRNPDSF